MWPIRKHELYLPKSGGRWPPCPPCYRRPCSIAPTNYRGSDVGNSQQGRRKVTKFEGHTKFIFIFLFSFSYFRKNGFPSVPHTSAGIDHHHTYQIATILPKKLAWLCCYKLQIEYSQKLIGLNQQDRVGLNALAWDICLCFSRYASWGLLLNIMTSN